MCFRMKGVVLCKSCNVGIVQDAGGVYNPGRKDNGGVGGKKGYIYSNSCHLIHILRFVGYWTQNGPAFIFNNHQGPHEWGASRRDVLLVVRTVCDAGRCFGITYHHYHSDLIHLGANWVVLRLSQQCNHPTTPPMPSGGKSTCNWCQRTENMSLFALRCI